MYLFRLCRCYIVPFCNMYYTHLSWNVCVCFMVAIVTRQPCSMCDSDWLLEIQDLGTPMTSQCTHTHVYCINPVKCFIPYIPERKGYTRMLQFNFQPNLLNAREIICFKVIVYILLVY